MHHGPRNPDVCSVMRVAITRIHLVTNQLIAGTISSTGLWYSAHDILELNIGETPSRFYRKHNITRTEKKDRDASVIKVQCPRGQTTVKQNCKTNVWGRREKGVNMVQRHRITLVS